MNKKELKNKGKLLEPIIRIGKNGLKDSVIDEINKHLKKRKLIKIKFLKSFIKGEDRKRIAQEIATKTNSVLIDQVGFVAVLCQKPPVRDKLHVAYRKCK